MEIRELHLKHYGKFDDHRISLQPGINIIYGKNETGKTTIHSFIRAMFFGLPRGRGRQAKADEYSLRQPWENPSYFAGSMTILEGGETYRIDRNFNREQQTCTVDNLSKAARAADGEQEIRRLFGWMNETVFCNTLFVRQARVETEEALAEELRGFLVNYDRALGMQTDVSRALQSLQKKKKEFLQKKKAEEELLEEQIGRRQAEADYVRREIDSLKERGEALSAGPSEEPGTENQEEEPKERSPKYRILTEVFLAAAALTAFAMAWLFRALRIRIFLGIFAALFLALILPVHKLLSGDEDEAKDWPKEMGEQSGAVREQLQRQEEKYQQLQNELEELYQNHVKTEGSAIEIEALNMAIDRISDLSASVFKESGGGLAQKTSEIFGCITGGRYTGVSMDGSLDIRILSRDRVLDLRELSFGTMQQVYFALRVAAGELFAKGRQFPLIFDEPFAMYDDARLAAVLRWLYRSGRQVILFTCQDRERRILEKIKAAGGASGQKKEEL